MSYLKDKEWGMSDEHKKLAHAVEKELTESRKIVKRRISYGEYNETRTANK